MGGPGQGAARPPAAGSLSAAVPFITEPSSPRCEEAQATAPDARTPQEELACDLLDIFTARIAALVAQQQEIMAQVEARADDLTETQV